MTPEHNDTNELEHHDEERVIALQREFTQRWLEDARECLSDRQGAPSTVARVVAASAAFARVARTDEALIARPLRDDLVRDLTAWMRGASQERWLQHELWAWHSERSRRAFTSLRHWLAHGANPAHRASDMIRDIDESICADASLRRFFRKSAPQHPTVSFIQFEFCAHALQLSPAQPVVAALSRTFNRTVVLRANEALDALADGEALPETTSTWKWVARRAVLPIWRLSRAMNRQSWRVPEMRANEARASQIADRVLRTLLTDEIPLLAAAAGSLPFPAPEELRYLSPNSGFAQVLVPVASFRELPMYFCDDTGEPRRDLDGQIVQWLHFAATIMNGVARFTAGQRAAHPPAIDRGVGHFLSIGESIWYLDT